MGIGVAAVGPVRSQDGYVHFAPNLGWSEVPWRSASRGCSASTCPWWSGTRRTWAHGRSICGVPARAWTTSSTSRATWAWVRASSRAGGHWWAPEAMPARWVTSRWCRTGRSCGCGSHGCWETVVGERALLRGAGRDPDGGPREVDAVLRAAEAGELGPMSAVLALGRWLGIGLAGLVNTFDPQVVVLGGLFGRLAPLVHEPMDAELAARVMSVSRDPVRVVASSAWG